LASVLSLSNITNISLTSTHLSCPAFDQTPSTRSTFSHYSLSFYRFKPLEHVVSCFPLGNYKIKLGMSISGSEHGLVSIGYSDLPIATCRIDLTESLGSV
jgi:hypothetical protein